MEWLSQNWVWLVFGVAMVWMMRRGGAGGCCGGHVEVDKRPAAEGAQTKDASAGDCCGGGHGADDRSPEAEGGQNARAGAVHQH